MGRLLDYGCGRGTDADLFNMYRWDPYWSPDDTALHRYKFHTITCLYVLNTVYREEGDMIVADVIDLLAHGGRAYFAVRRDIPDFAWTRKTTIQRQVYLDFPIMREDRSYCLYEYINYREAT